LKTLKKKWVKYKTMYHRKQKKLTDFDEEST
jgi:hypothetical protein